MKTKSYNQFRPAWAAALGLALALPGAAFANSTAYSTFQITGGIFSETISGDQLTIGDQILNPTLTSSLLESATRSSGPGSELPNSSTGFATDSRFTDGIDYSSGLQTDGGIVLTDPCVGVAADCTFGENNFGQAALGSGEFSRAAALKQGTGVAGTTGGPIAGGLLTDLASIEMQSSKSSSSGAVTNASSNVGFTFSLTEDLQVEFDANITSVAQAILDDKARSGNILASSSFTFSIRDQAAAPGVFELLDIVTLVPGLSATNVGIVSVGNVANAVTPGESNTLGFVGQAFKFRTVNDLLANHTYAVSFIVNTNGTLSQEVPEPAPLALLSLGLVVAAVSRRQRPKG